MQNSFCHYFKLFRFNIYLYSAKNINNYVKSCYSFFAHKKSYLNILFLFWLSACTTTDVKTNTTIKKTPLDSLSKTAIINLGKQLFYDNNLSFNETKSCASCHNPSLAFTDGYRTSTTATGNNLLRNAPSLVNATYQKKLDWANPLINDLYSQNERPLFNEHPIELGAKNNEKKILAYFNNNMLYKKIFAAAFKNDTTITFIHIRKSLAAFVSTIVSAQSPYDKYITGDSNQLSASAKNGLQLFFSKKLQCTSCHPPPYFSLNNTANANDSIYVNTGLYNIDNTGSYIENDNGLFAYTHEIKDKGKFKIPSLRNVGVTAPYMHNGSIATLSKVIDIYARGGQLTTIKNLISDGKLNPNKDKRIKGFSLTAIQKKDLINFLYSLTDTTIANNQAFINPHNYH